LYLSNSTPLLTRLHAKLHTIDYDSHTQRLKKRALIENSTIRFLQKCIRTLVISKNREKRIILTNIRNITEKIKTLDAERNNLLLEFEGLKKLAESKTRALESEVSMLREEVESLRILLGGEATDPPKTEPEEPSLEEPQPPSSAEPELEKSKVNFLRRRK
jgi:hypothetical protein